MNDPMISDKNKFTHYRTTSQQTNPINDTFASFSHGMGTLTGTTVGYARGGDNSGGEAGVTGSV